MCAIFSEKELFVLDYLLQLQKNIPPPRLSSKTRFHGLVLDSNRGPLGTGWLLNHSSYKMCRASIQPLQPSALAAELRRDYMMNLIGVFKLAVFKKAIEDQSNYLFEQEETSTSIDFIYNIEFLLI